MFQATAPVQPYQAWTTAARTSLPAMVAMAMLAMVLVAMVLVAMVLVAMVSMEVTAATVSMEITVVTIRNCRHRTGGSYAWDGWTKRTLPGTL